MSMDSILIPDHIKVESFRRFEWGRNPVYDCHGLVDGKPSSFVVKIWQEGTRDRASHEIETLARLLPTSIPVPRILYREASPEPFIIMERVQGVPLKSALLADEPCAELHSRLRQYGRTLALIHQQESITKAPFRDHEALIKSYEDVDGFREIREWLIENKPQDPERVLCHGDYNPRNVFVDGDTLTGVIDWEDAGLGMRETDIAKALTGDAEEVAAILEGYTELADYDDANLKYASVESCLVGACALHRNGVPRYIEGIETANSRIAEDGFPFS